MRVKSAIAIGPPALIADWMPFNGRVAPMMMIEGPPRERRAATYDQGRHMRGFSLASIMNKWPVATRRFRGPPMRDRELI